VGEIDDYPHAHTRAFGDGITNANPFAHAQS
jgi:hypothetical protein